MHSDFCNGHASILVSLPHNHCEQVRDVIEVLSVLEEVYNHLYAWCLFVHEAAIEPDGMNGHPSYPSVCSFTGLLDGVPDEDRLCVARIEVNPPAFVEIIGAHRVLRAMRAYLAVHDDGDEFTRAPKMAFHSEGVDFVRREVDLLYGLNFSRIQIQEALSKHILVPLARLEKLRGIRLYEEKETLAEAGQAIAPG